MDQMEVTFRLLPGLTWSGWATVDFCRFCPCIQPGCRSDGSRVRCLVNRTKSYEATDKTTVQWWGKPGFIDTTYLANFWPPLPQHLWGQIPAGQLADDPGASRAPVGWGSYVIQEWVAGDHITLVKNPHYFPRR